MGPTGEPSDLPLLKLSLTIDAQPEEFNDRAFRMRLAGLLGIDEEMIATRTSRLKNNIGMKLDSAIKCKDAISLVNTAKMLKKPPRTLGLALGVSLIDDPSLVVPEPESMPQPEGPPLPALSVRFEIEGDFVSFDESAFLRRVTTLVGVDPSMVSASLTAGTTGSAINIDAEIKCPDAVTLVMAAKTLNKPPATLGLALGVHLLEKPAVRVPEPPSADEAIPSAKAQGKAPVTPLDGPPTREQNWGVKALTFNQPAVTADAAIAPTIQERIPHHRWERAYSLAGS